MLCKGPLSTAASATVGTRLESVDCHSLAAFPLSPEQRGLPEQEDHTARCGQIPQGLAGRRVFTSCGEQFNPSSIVILTYVHYQSNVRACVQGEVGSRAGIGRRRGRRCPALRYGSCSAPDGAMPTRAAHARVLPIAEAERPVGTPEVQQKLTSSYF